MMYVWMKYPGIHCYKTCSYQSQLQHQTTIIMRKLTIPLLLFLVFSVTQLSAQTDSEIDSLLDDILFEDTELLNLISQQKTLHFIYINSELSNKSFFAGREIGTNQYNISSQLSYFNTNGIFAGVSGAWYSQLDPQYGTTVVSLGYGKTLKQFKNISLRTSYSRYIYNFGEESFDPDYNSNIRIGATLKKQWAGTRIDLTYLMGNANATNINWSIYSKINLYKFSKYNKVQLVPQFSIFFGEEAVEYQEVVRRNFTQTLTENKFGVLNAQISLPLRVSYKNFDFELGYSYNLPQSLDAEYTYDNASQLNISIGYIFGF